MDAPTTILLADVRSSVETRLRSAFHDVDFTPLPKGRWVRQTLREISADAAVVKVDASVEQSFHLVHELSEAGLRVLVLGDSKDPDLILRVMREGAKEFVLASDEKEIVRALGELLRPLRGDTGRVCAVFGAKGGVGATTLATNLAGAFQRAGARTCLVDLKLQMGDVLAFLDLPGGYSIADMIGNMRRLDRELLDSTLLRHASGIHVLAQSHRIDECDLVQPSELGSVIGFLRNHYGAVVLDGLGGFDELSIAALDACDEILLVVTQEVPAVRDARRCLELFGRLGAADRLKLVVNRFQKDAEITPPVIAETVGAPVAATIANDYPAVIRGVNRGHLVIDEAPRSLVTKNVQQLLTVLGHTPRIEEQQQKPSLLRRFLTPRTSHATT